MNREAFKKKLDDARDENDYVSTQFILDLLEEELKASDLQNQELQKEAEQLRERLTNVKWETQDELLAHWNKGMEKHGYHIHPGLSPEQNAAEWAAKVQEKDRLNERLQKVVDALDKWWSTKHEDAKAGWAPVIEALNDYRQQTEKPKQEGCTCGTTSHIHDGNTCALALKREGRP